VTGASRDRAIERLLASPPGRPSRDAIGPCVEPEAVAAWLDGGLPAAAAEQFEAHVAACAACQELLTTVVRMTPVDAPALQAAERRLWKTWALPLAAAAVLVLAVWTSWPGSRTPAAPAVLKEESRVARAEPPVPASEPEPPAAAPAQLPDTQSTRRRAPAAVTEERPGQPPAPAARAPAATPLDAPVADRSAREAAQAETFAARQEAEAQADDVGQRAQQKAAAPPQATAAESRAPAAGSPGGLAGSAQLARGDGAARVAVQAPGTQWRWRANRVLEYSSDAGATWRPSSGADAAQVSDILAGASPGQQMVWLVGRRGLVLVTTDGMRFDLRSPPAAIDLLAVQPTDHLTAIVRSATGDAWRTTDGGRSWSRVER
jgi:hypothetical protein